MRADQSAEGEKHSLNKIEDALKVISAGGMVLVIDRALTIRALTDPAAQAQGHIDTAAHPVPVPAAGIRLAHS